MNLDLNFVWELILQMISEKDVDFSVKIRDFTIESRGFYRGLLHITIIGFARKCGISEITIFKKQCAKNSIRNAEVPNFQDLFFFLSNDGLFGQAAPQQQNPVDTSEPGNPAETRGFASDSKIPIEIDIFHRFFDPLKYSKHPHRLP